MIGARTQRPGRVAWVGLLAGLIGGATVARGDSHPQSLAGAAAFDPIVHRLPGSGQLPTTLGMRRRAQDAGGAGTSAPAPRAGTAGQTGAQTGAQTGDAQADERAGNQAGDGASGLTAGSLADEAAARAALSRAERTRRQEREIFGQKPLSDKVIFRVNMGWGLDGGEPAVANVPEYGRLRTYYYGDVVIGSRGLLSPNLSSYLASQFRIDTNLESGGQTLALPVPSLFDAQIGEVPDLWIRSGYATWKGVSGIPALEPLYIRAGRQFRYGPAIAHFDGLTIGYDGPAFSFGAFSGRVIDQTGFNLGDFYSEVGVVSGLDTRLDLQRVLGTPLVLSGEVLRFDETTHMRGALALRLNRDIALRATVRSRGGRIARTGVRLRARLRRVTLVDVRVENRSADDWMYDLFASGDPREGTRVDNPLYFINLGPVLPRLYFEARAGTVLLRNVDVLLHGRGAIRRTADEERSPHATSFAQGGVAIEVHVRRSVNLGLGFLARQYWRSEPTQPAMEPDGVADELPDITSDAVGERAFAEGNATIRFSQGARKFSAGAELYLRAYDFQSSYVFPDDGTGDQLPERLGSADLRGGGRFTVEGWAGDNLRLKAVYDLTTALVVVPELRGIKSLRLLAEGRF